MLRIIRAAERHFKDLGWLKAIWLFSFSDYHDPNNLSFGLLQVFNDDVIEPGKGFPSHPHRDMEIISIVLEGELTHEDNTGAKGVIKPGEIQHMTAGSGIIHSEYNQGKDPCHLYQLWLLPRKTGLAPSHSTRSFEPQNDTLQAVASGKVIDDALQIESDATIYRATLNPGKEIIHRAERTFIYITTGKLHLNNYTLTAGDQVRAEKEDLTLRAEQTVSFILVDC